MSYQKHLQKTGCVFSYTGDQRSKTTGIVALALLFFWAVFVSYPTYGAECSLQDLTVSAAPQKSTLDTPPVENWQPVTLPDNWSSRWPEMDTVWYRIQWQEMCQNQTLALSVDYISMAGIIYLNDTLLWQDANLTEPFSRSWNMPRYWVLPNAALNKTDNSLWIRVTGMPYDMLGLGQVTLGSPNTVLPLYKKQLWQQRYLFILSAAMSLALACLFFILWVFRRQEKPFIWYALASLSWAIFCYTILATSPWPFSNSSDWNRAAGVIFAFYCTFFCFFTWSFSGQRFPKLAQFLMIIALLFLVLVWWVPNNRLTEMLAATVFICSLIFLINCVQFQFYAWRYKQRHNILLALCLLFFLIAGMHDVLVVFQFIEGGYTFVPYTSPIATIFMCLIIADRFARNLHQIEGFNLELQKAVNDTRSELTSTLQRKHELEASNIRLTERLRLSHDLHDSLGGSLVRSIATVEQSNRVLNNHQFLSMLKELRDDLRQIIDNDSSNLHSESMTPIEWIAPLRHRFVVLFEELDVESTWEMPPTWPCELSSIQRLALIRVLEESLTNAIKHSRAKRIEVAMYATEKGSLALYVYDNGVGFSLDKVAKGRGIGLHSMQARIAKIGGQFEVSSQPNETKVSVYLSE